MKREKFVEKLTSKFVANKAKLAGITTAAMVAMPTVVNAGNWGSNTGEAKGIVSTMADIVVNIFPFVGVFLALPGAFKMIMAYRNDQPEAMSSAAKDVVIGAILIIFRVFAWEPLKGAMGL